MLQTSWIELSASALRNNLGFLRRMVGPGVQLCSVVKGNAYGHGIDSYVPLAQACGLQHFGVFGADEAEAVLRAKKEPGDVMIMGPLLPDAMEWAVENDLSFFVSDVSALECAVAIARKREQKARIHLDLETGLNRTGLDREALERVVPLLHEHRDGLVLEGACTHFAGAESVGNYLRIQHQIERFRETASWLRSQGITVKRHHTACSAAALNYPETRMDMVRFGIAQYGLWSSLETRMHYEMGAKGHAERKRDPLRRVLTWKSRVVHVKSVPPNEFVGYGTSYLTDRAQTIAIIPVGYASGFSRQLSNVGRVLVHGRRVGVVGLVNMSVLMVDVTNVRGVEVGDEVVLIGKQKRRAISVVSFSDLAGQLNYEMLVKLDPTIPRTVVK